MPLRIPAWISFSRDFGAPALDELLHDRFVRVRARLDQLVPHLLALVDEISGNLLPLELCSQRFVVENRRLHPHEVDHAAVLVFLPHRPLDRHRTRPEPLADRVDVHLKIGADLVHLVDERMPRHLVAVGLPPHRLALRLHAVAAVEHGDRAVEHAQAALDLDREVDVSRSVDDVDPVFFALERAEHRRPKAVGGGAGDGDAAFLLLHHPIHGRRAFVHLAELVADARVKQDPLGTRRLAGIDVRHDADIARAFDCEFAGHCSRVVSGWRRCWLSRQNPLRALAPRILGSAAFRKGFGVRRLPFAERDARHSASFSQPDVMS